MCQSCPVVEVCLWRTMLREHGLGRDLRFGVVGAMDRRERVLLARRNTLKRIRAQLTQAITRHRVGSAPVLTTVDPVPRRTEHADRKRQEVKAAFAGLAAAMGVTKAYLRSNDRAPNHVRDRFVVMTALRMKGFSYPTIGLAVGKDHSTVRQGYLHAISDPELAGAASVLADLDI